MNIQIDDKKNVSYFLVILIIILAIFLNLQKPLFDYNLSISDLAAVFLVLLLFFKKQLIIPRIIILFFLMLSIVTLMTAFFITPYRYEYIPNFISVMNDYFKLISSFFYFILGINILWLQRIRIVYKWYSIAAVTIGLLGILTIFFHINFLNNDFLFQDSRFIGLLNDPNYLSVVMCTALVYFYRAKSINKMLRFVCVILIFLTVVISGSKTGMIIFLFYSFITLLEYMIAIRSNRQLIRKILIFIPFVILLPVMLSYFTKILDKLIMYHPVFNRVMLLFYNFDDAISSNGSTRENTWVGAINIIQESPFGVGIGSYLDVSKQIFGDTVLAHNTFLQIAAEWGLVFSIIFFLFLCYIMIRHTSSDSYRNNLDSMILKHIMFILFIGSLSLSLNNARMFWLFAGALYASSKRRSALTSLPKKITNQH